jgi:TPR repeat protein
MKVVKRVLGTLAKVRVPLSKGRGGRNNPYAAFERGEFALAFAGFAERLRKKKDPLAMHHMGWLVENGHGGEASDETAKEWYRKSVEHGHHASALALSDLAYREGQYRDAFDWADYAAGKKVPGAKEARDRAYRAAGLNLQWWR